MNGQRQPKQPTKGETVKIRKALIITTLEEIRGRILDITDGWNNEYVPLNLLGEMLFKYKYKDEGMDTYTEEKEAWNDMLLAIMATAKSNSDKYMLNDKLPMKTFDALIDFYIAATNEAKPIIKNS